jgi:hypothetical protein
MPTADNSKRRLHLHSEIALTIKAAKKALFARHRAGMALAETLRLFRLDIQQRLEKIAPENTAETESPREFVEAFQAKQNAILEHDEAEYYGGYKLLSDEELTLACEQIAEELSEEYHCGLMILILDHLVAVSVRDRYPTVESTVIDIQETFVRTNIFTIAFTIDALRDKTSPHLLRQSQADDTEGD